MERGPPRKRLGPPVPGVRFLYLPPDIGKQTCKVREPLAKRAEPHGLGFEFSTFRLTSLTGDTNPAKHPQKGDYGTLSLGDRVDLGARLQSALRGFKSRLRLLRKANPAGIGARLESVVATHIAEIRVLYLPPLDNGRRMC